LRIAICDDNIRELEETHRMVLDYIGLHEELDISVRKFQAAYDLLDCIDAGICFDIFILDIMMPYMNGIDVGGEIRKKDDHSFIIYLTNSTDFALKSYEVSAFQYLTKPISQEGLHMVLDNIIKRFDYEITRSIPVKTKNGVCVIPFHRIVSAEYVNHSVVYHLTGGEVVTSSVTREPFGVTAGKLLKDDRFICCHVSYVVNMRFVASIDNKKFFLQNGQSIPISARHSIETRKRYFDFLLRVNT